MGDKQAMGKEQPDRRRNLVPVSKFLETVPVSRDGAYKLFREKKLPCFHFGRRIFVDIDECLTAMRQKNG